MEATAYRLSLIAEKIVYTFQSILDHLNCRSHCKQNLKNLKNEMNALENQKNTIARLIDEAKSRGEVIEGDVLDWRYAAEWQIQEVGMYIEANVKENVPCADFISRYRLSNEAKKKLVHVQDLLRTVPSCVYSRPMPPPLELLFPSNSEYVSLGSRESALNNIMEALKDSRVNTIWVHGMGGVGKTTTVLVAAQQAKEYGLFHEFVMAVVSPHANVVKIQAELACCLGLQWEDETQGSSRAARLRYRLNNGKNNLVILDDVREDLDLKEIGIPLRDGYRGCKVILTSRNRCIPQNQYCIPQNQYCVPRNMLVVDIEVYIAELSDEEAWCLLKRRINYVDATDQLHDIARAVCKECRGLPAAVLAVGRALEGKSTIDAWENSLAKLRMSPLNDIEDIDPRLFASLKLSYDYLESAAKFCFLFCGMFPEHAEVPIEELARHCMARRLLEKNPDSLKEARYIVNDLVNSLKTRCLVLEGKNGNFLKMDDTMRRVAVSIAKENGVLIQVRHDVEERPMTGTFEKYSAISLTFETIRELPDELVCPELQTLILKCSSDKFQPELGLRILNTFFRGTEKLMVLELNRIHLSPLPSSLAKLKKLRMLCLNECKLGDIAMLGYLHELEVLGLRGSDIEKLPAAVGELTRLCSLDMGDCDQLKVIPNGIISKLCRLEELHFPLSFGNWEDTIGNEQGSKVSPYELRWLTQLSTLDIWLPYLRLLPMDDFLHRKWIRSKIKVGSLLVTYGGGDWSSEGFMKFDGAIRGSDDFNIWHLLGKPRLFIYLTQLLLEDCSCSRLKHLFSPSCARELQQLQHLVISRSEIIEAVIGEEPEEITADVIYFSQLKILVLEGLPRLRSFYPRITEGHSVPLPQSLFNEKVAFPALEEISVGSLPNITEIWDKNLPLAPTSPLLRTSMTVKNCEKLIHVAPLHMLQYTRTLTVYNCPKMEMIAVLNKTEEVNPPYPYYVFQLPHLEFLRLENLETLSSFNDTNIITETRPLFNNQVAVLALEEISIGSLPNITEIWDKNLLSAHPSPLLRTSMTVKNCEKLMYVAPLHLLQNTRTLTLYNCPNMEMIAVLNKMEEVNSRYPYYVFHLPHLEFLRLENLETLSCFNNTSIITETRPLFNSQVAILALEEISIGSLPNITEIWDKNLLLAHTSPLLRTSMTVENCEKLMHVAPLHLLQNTRALTVRNCRKMEMIAVLNEMEEVNPRYPCYVFHLPHLEFLRLENLEALSCFNNTSIITETRPLFNSQVSVLALEDIFIGSLPNITEIWDKNLLLAHPSPLLRTSMTVKNCEKLMHVAPLHLLQNTRALIVSNCPMMEMIAVLNKTEEVNPRYPCYVFHLPHLQFLRLENLVKLSCFNNTSIITKPQPLFNSQVAVLALEEISIGSLPNIKEIWDKNLLLVQTSPLQWTSMTFQNCKELMHVAPLHLLQNTRTLTVSNCPNMEVIAVLDEREEKMKGNQVHPNYVLRLPHLRSLRLEYLNGLSCFNNTSIITKTRPLFNNQVAFPALEELFIGGVPIISEIWDNNSLPAESFYLLRSLEVVDCKNLLNVAPSQMLPPLQNMEALAVYDCSSIEVIAVLEKREEEIQEATNVDIILFPKLWRMSLQKLDNLRGVCAYKTEDQHYKIQVPYVVQGYSNLEGRSKEEIEEKQVDHNYGLQFPRLRILLLKNLRTLSSFYNTSLKSQMQPLFNHQVALPALEQLSVDSVPNIIEIWDKNLLSTKSFCPMKCLTVRGCKKLMNVASSNMLPLLQNIRTLAVDDCPEMEVIVVLVIKRREEVDRDHVLKFPHLWFLKLKNLKKLSCFNSTSIMTERQLLFNHQVAFPALAELFVDSLPNITELWDRNVLLIENFCRLRSVEIKGCKNMINVVPSHMLPLLGVIEALEVDDCPEMEVIVVLEKSEVETQEATSRDLIMFPKLRRMRLQKLENLKGLCAYKSEDQRYFNVQVQFPMLKDPWPRLDEHSNIIFAKANKMKGIAEGSGSLTDRQRRNQNFEIEEVDQSECSKEPPNRRSGKPRPKGIILKKLMTF